MLTTVQRCEMVYSFSTDMADRQPCRSAYLHASGVWLGIQ